LSERGIAVERIEKPIAQPDFFEKDPQISPLHAPIEASPKPAAEDFVWSIARTVTTCWSSRRILLYKLSHDQEHDPDEL
jgi:hypothetical protein